MLCDLTKRMSKPDETVPDHMIFRFEKIFLPVGPEQRYGGAEPPERCDQESKDHGRLHTDADIPCTQNDHKTDYKGITASNIPPRISMGRHRVHPVRLSDVIEHGIIKHKACRISCLRDHKDHKKPEQEDRNPRTTQPRTPIPSQRKR